jgi:hypothetical protein
MSRRLLMLTLLAVALLGGVNAALRESIVALDGLQVRVERRWTRICSPPASCETL